MWANRNELEAWDYMVRTAREWSNSSPRACIARARNVEKQANDDAARFVAAVEGL